jgi:acyl carrier protein
MTETELLDFVATFAYLDRSLLTLETELTTIDIDSLAKMELVFQLEDHLKLELHIPNNDVNLDTLQDVLDLINRHLP